MGQEGETWKTWSGAKGTAAEKGRQEKFARAGQIPKRLQRGGVQRFLDAHARGLERWIREVDSMGFYTHLKGVNLEISRKYSLQFIRDEKGGLLRELTMYN